mmetsp:Transcript_1642/g.2873  ORF Transcript_1642/g.2873 Transcript_1642/m.2873 type:complete len:183 (-) Transcript_1642:15-563(-)
MSQLERKMTQARVAFEEQKVEARAARQEARKVREKKIRAKKQCGENLSGPFRRPCGVPQELGCFQRLPVQYLEPKHAAMMDRPDRCRWYSKENHPAFLAPGQVPRTFDDPLMVQWAKKKDPNAEVDIRGFLEPKAPPPREIRRQVGPAWKHGSATPRELDSLRPLLERAGHHALLAAPKSAR